MLMVWVTMPLLFRLLLKFLSGEMRCAEQYFRLRMRCMMRLQEVLFLSVSLQN
jgi:hypothetical protein